MSKTIAEERREESDQRLIDNGTICRVGGHQWVNTTGHRTADDFTRRRHCLTCLKCEKLEWHE
ncbi:hypothetical protein LCGC14_0410990 [marine sediment metagenome]|uniref:Uncharacterized protein n=1 Tax=marine sediment metagenome TaxID=412755 RepID=A0A0F9W2X0_9ZZZZ